MTFFFCIQYTVCSRSTVLLFTVLCFQMKRPLPYQNDDINKYTNVILAVSNQYDA